MITLTERVTAYRAAHPSVTEAEALDAVQVLHDVTDHARLIERIAGADLQIRRASLAMAFAIYDAHDLIDLETVRDTLVDDIAILTHQLDFLDKKRAELARLKAERER